jgi:hypothetical protein
MRKAFLIVALAMIVAIPVALAQQPTTGTLQGIVGEQDGKPLPGATVVVKGPLGERAAQTDAQGQFEFRFLPAGTYTVRAEMPGYSTVEIGGVDINAAGRTRLPITLLPGQTAEITVSSAAPLLDVKRTTVSTAFKSKSLESLPIGRNFTDAVAFAPGVVSGLGTGQGNYSVGGSSGLENSYIIDGVNITDGGYGGVGTYSLVYGSLGTGITTDFLDEVAVKSGAFDAEYGQALGGVITGVVKSGTNAFSGAVRAYYSTWSNGKYVVLPTGATNIDYDDSDVIDLGLSVGGPIIKDKLFWFVAYNPVRATNNFDRQSVRNPMVDLGAGMSQIYDEEVYPSSRTSGVDVERTNQNYAAKVNWQITPSHRLEFTGFGDPSDGGGRSGVTASEYLMTGRQWNANNQLTIPTEKYTIGFGDGGRSNIDYGADQFSLKYSGLFGSDWFLEAQANYRKNEFTEDPIKNEYAYSDTRVPREWTYGGTIPYSVTPFGGGPGYIGPQVDESYDYALKISKVFGNHELKAGVQYFDLEYSQSSAYSGATTLFNFPADFNGDGVKDGFVPLESTSGATVSIRGGYRILNDDLTTSEPCTGCAFSVGYPQYRTTRARFNPESPPTKASDLSFFVQDTWTISDQWVVKLGLRTTSQELEGSGEFTLDFARSGTGYYTDTPTTYSPNSYKFDTEWSPRVGVTFDPGADGKTKFQFNYARYFQRVPNDLAVRQFSNEVGTTTFTFYDPQLTSEVYRTGSASPNVQGIDLGVVADGTKLPYVDEFVLGWQQLIRPDLSIEVRGIYRDQGRVLEDTQGASVEAIHNYYYGYDHNEDGSLEGDIPFPGVAPAPFGAYVLSNPGENAGEGFPAPKRTYKALEVSLTKQLSNNWQFAANYRYSRLRGNYEGLFRNDNGQSDPNITSLFDFPNSFLMRGQYASGPLNTDRPHVLNMFGTYFFDFGLEVGGALQWQSGVPRTALLAHPIYLNAGELPGQDPIFQFFDYDANAWAFGECDALSAASGLCFVGDYTDAPRGSLGRTPDFAALDLHLGYNLKFKDTGLKFVFDVRNLFNSLEATGLDDAVESQAAILNVNFNKINAYQEPRQFRLGVIFDF